MGTMTPEEKQKPEWYKQHDEILLILTQGLPFVKEKVLFPVAKEIMNAMPEESDKQIAKRKIEEYQKEFAWEDKDAVFFWSIKNWLDREEE